MRVLKSASFAASALFLVLAVVPAAHADARNDDAGSQVKSDVQVHEARWAQVSAKAREFQTRRSAQFLGVKNGDRSKAFLAMAIEARNGQ